MRAFRPAARPLLPRRRQTLQLVEPVQNEVESIRYSGALVGADGQVVFAHKLGVDAPGEGVTGPDLVNAPGAH